ncbi:beta-ketoacyl synthase N-terminal-like domain-containing protein [Streptomyces sp. NPDC058701]|uniref:beta-ketoacyl synthase N-terminal-like domain-containing protein n=1 Tax=Streptomyces sp. NPDC058701 TaxID=3346608 RepID=UPI0036541E3B
MTFDDRIAIVGMHLKLPTGIDTAEGFWQLLIDGRDVFTRGPVTGGRVNLTSHIADANWFAAEPFGISEYEAGLTDPQHRLLLELAWECLRTAGSGQDSVTGVFSSCSPSSFFEEILLHRPDLWARNVSQILEGTQGDYLATRIAYRLGLTGPALHIGTGCSSSLVALNQAIQALNAFQCDRALVAAASIHSPGETGYEVREGGIYSADGYCRPFADDANGTVPGNGAAVILLKRLEDALADGDPVHAVVLGSAVNNDGDRKVGFVAPSIDGQLDCVTTALDNAELEPALVSYLEAHGTGTRVGDPIELRALAKAYGTPGPGGRHLGSVKANIGHCDVAAGLFGLIKTALILTHATLPPQINLTAPTTAHDWSDGSLSIARTAVDLRAGRDADAPLIAGVSSLGVGGTNAHVLLQDARSLIGADEADRRTPRPVVRIPGRIPYEAVVHPESSGDEAGAGVQADADSAATAAPVADTVLFELFSQHTAEPVTALDEDFFALGGDSFGLLHLLDEIDRLTGVELSVEEFTARPTAAHVRARLDAAAAAGAAAGAAGPAAATGDRGDSADDAGADDADADGADAEAIRAIADRHAGLTLADAVADPDGPVLLTGATGFVGAHVLADLLAAGRQVVCVLRGGEERRAAVVEQLRSITGWDPARERLVTCVAGDITRPRLGLDGPVYDTLADRVAWVIHSAAAVNHVYPYAGLAAVNTDSAAGIVEFAATTRRKALTYLSTTAVFSTAAYAPGSEITAGPVTALPPESDGYGRSKALAEHHFRHAGELGLSAVVLRIPNVFGDRTSRRINAGDAIWSWTKAILMTGHYPRSFDMTGDELFQALPGDVVARVVTGEARPTGEPGCRFVNAVPNLVCSSRGMLAGLHTAGHHPESLADADWYRMVADLDPRDVWVASLAGRLADRPETGLPLRLHRFPLDDDPAVAEAVNHNAVWSPADLAGYLAAPELVSPTALTRTEH